MKTGRFDAVGYETPPASITLFLTLVGTLQIFPVLALSEFSGTYLWLYTKLVFPSCLILILSLLIAAYINRRLTRENSIGAYSVDFADNGRGELELSYANTRGVRREHLVPKSVTINRVLWRTNWKGGQPVDGVVAALGIKFKHRRGRLHLGFPTEQVMRDVYEILRQS